jgi:hypothetical protein
MEPEVIFDRAPGSIPLTLVLASRASRMNCVIQEGVHSCVSTWVKSQVTAAELYNRIIGEIGDPGGLIILVLRSDDGGGLAKLYDGPTSLFESGFQTALDDIVARLRLRYDLYLYGTLRPMEGVLGSDQGWQLGALPVTSFRQ